MAPLLKAGYFLSIGSRAMHKARPFLTGRHSLHPSKRGVGAGCVDFAAYGISAAPIGFNPKTQNAPTPDVSAGRFFFEHGSWRRSTLPLAALNSGVEIGRYDS